MTTISLTGIREGEHATICLGIVTFSWDGRGTLSPVGLGKTRGRKCVAVKSWPGTSHWLQLNL